MNSKIGRIVAKAKTKEVQPQKEKVVIVGGGSGGINTIESLRMVGGGTQSMYDAEV